MFANRIIPCLDVSEGYVVKGVRFRNHEVVGAIEDLARLYADQGADELVFYDISASASGGQIDCQWVEKVASQIDIPFCVAGGLTTEEACRRVLYSGADKVSVNTPALMRPELISELSAAFGRQCVVVGIDSERRDRDYWVKSHTGRVETQQSTPWRTLDWVRRVQDLGAGEIVLNCMDQDGVRRGYDIEQLRQVRALCRVPLVASGGAGQVSDFVNVFKQARVSGALAASVFHKGLLTVSDVKRACLESGVSVRPPRTH